MNNKVSSIVGRVTALALLASPLLVTQLKGQEVYSQIVGAMSIDVPSNSDVIVSPAFARSAVHRGTLSAASNGGTATFSTADFSTLDLSGYKLLIESDSLTGRMFDISSDNNGAMVTVSDPNNELGAAAGATAAVVPALSLDYLFPSGVAGISEANPGDPDVLVFFNDNSQSTDGFYPEAFYYYYDSAWRKVGSDMLTDYGSSSLEIGEGVVVRNNGDEPITLYLYGELLEGNIQVPVASKPADSVDNLLGLPRPLDVALADIGLAGSSAFVTTTDSDSPADLLLVYGNATAEKNPEPLATYYYFNGAWRKVGDSDTVSYDDAVIPAGAAIVLRKAPFGSSDAVVYWTSTWDTSGLDI